MSAAARGPRAPRQAALALALALAPLASACEPTPPECNAGPERVPAAALSNATQRAEYLLLEPAQTAAVVAIEADGALWCSGVLVGPHTVLSARHCMVDATPPPLLVRFGPDFEHVEARVAAHIVAVHPERDVLVLQLQDDAVAAAGAQPLPVAAALPEGLVVGSLVQTAGFGPVAQSAGRREFLVESVDSIGDTDIVVDAGGYAGACFGDSGGPLLARGDDGRAFTLGLLDAGSRNCRGVDRYTRVDDLGDWLAGVVGATESAPLPPSGAAYAALGEVGRCFDGVAVWTRQGALHATPCDAAHACGFSERAGGYRCLDGEHDPCRGIGELGQCEDGVAVQCRGGRLDDNPCQVCDYRCMRSPKTGRAICAAGSGAPDGG